ncbi:MAG: ketoacyl-ACP synthase III [Chitinophagales bacterium]
MNNIGIIATGHYVPEAKLTNKALEGIVKNFDPKVANKTLDEWIFNRYGIKSRSFSDELPSDQATAAAKKAIEKSNIAKEDIDFVILNTAFGDYIQPTTATEVQKKLGLRKDSFALEINMPCGGPTYGISMAHAFINSGKYKYGLVLGVDKMSKLVDLKDFRMAGLFGEGAGAAIVGPTTSNTIVDYVLRSKGEEGNEEDYALCIPAGYAKEVASIESVQKERHYLYMKGRLVEQFVESAVKEVVNYFDDGFGVGPEAITYVVPHQASKKMIIDKLGLAGIEAHKICFTLEEYGNTSAASVLITLDKFIDRFSKNDKVLLVAMGGGLNWGGVLLNFN